VRCPTWNPCERSGDPTPKLRVLNSRLTRPTLFVLAFTVWLVVGLECATGLFHT